MMNTNGESNHWCGYNCSRISSVDMNGILWDDDKRWAMVDFPDAGIPYNCINELFGICNVSILWILIRIMFPIP